MTKHCAFLTTDNLEGFTTDDDLAVPFLERLGWSVEYVSWRAQHVDWTRFDLVIPRSTWDYQDEPAAFDATLAHIEASGTLLRNPLPLMRWNMRKTYLRDLADRGVSTLPTVWGSQLTADTLRGLHAHLDASEIVIKPVVGANAQDAFRVRADVTDSHATEIAAAYAGRDYLAQAFIDNVVSEGEYSLIYFCGELSHTILKTPKTGDFRVQEEHGGIITATEPAPLLRRRADEAMRALDVVPLYARADFVRVHDNDFAIMEFELIEPALYLRMDAGAPARFAAAVDAVAQEVVA